LRIKTVATEPAVVKATTALTTSPTRDRLNELTILVVPAELVNSILDDIQEFVSRTVRSETTLSTSTNGAVSQPTITELAAVSLVLTIALVEGVPGLHTLRTLHVGVVLLVLLDHLDLVDRADRVQRIDLVSTLRAADTEDIEHLVLTTTKTTIHV
jgi:hypothetical protein